MVSRFSPPEEMLLRRARVRGMMQPRPVPQAVSDELLDLAAQAREVTRLAAARFDLSAVIDVDEAAL